MSDALRTGQPHGPEHPDALQRGLPIVLLHGLGSCGADWAPLADILRGRGHSVWTPDLPGHGTEAAEPGRQRSRPPRKITVLDHADRVTEWLDTRGVRGPRHLVGISLGSMVALELAARQPSCCASLTLLSPTPDTRLSRPHALVRYLKRRLAFELLGPFGHARWLAGRLFPRLDQQLLRDEFTARWRQLDRPAYRACLRGCAGWTIHGREQLIQCPTLLLSGRRAPLPPGQVRQLAGLIRSRSEEFDGVGHALLAEAPEWVLPRIQAFLESADRNPGVLDLVSDLRERRLSPAHRAR